RFNVASISVRRSAANSLASVASLSAASRQALSWAAAWRSKIAWCCPTCLPKLSTYLVTSALNVFQSASSFAFGDPGRFVGLGILHDDIAEFVALLAQVGENLGGHAADLVLH